MKRFSRNLTSPRFDFGLTVFGVLVSGLVLLVNLTTRRPTEMTPHWLVYSMICLLACASGGLSFYLRHRDEILTNRWKD